VVPFSLLQEVPVIEAHVPEVATMQLLPAPPTEYEPAIHFTCVLAAVVAQFVLFTAAFEEDIEEAEAEQ